MYKILWPHRHLFGRKYSEYIRKQIITAEEAVKLIKPGSSLLIGGFGLSGIPEKLIGAVSQNLELKYLTIYSNNAGVENFGVGLLIQNKQVKRMVSSYVGENKRFESDYLTGDLEIELVPQGTLAERIRAGGAGISAFYTHTGVGTQVEDGTMIIKYHKGTKTPEILSTPKEKRVFNGREYLLEPAITGDVALVKGQKADRAGNVIFAGSANNFNLPMAKAGQTTIVEVEEIVGVGQLRPEEIHLPGIYVDYLVLGKNYEKRIERKVVCSPTDPTLPKGTGIDEKKQRILSKAAEEIKRGMYVNLGIGIPMFLPTFIPSDMPITLHSENGILGLGPYPRDGEENPDIINAGKETVTVLPGGSFFSSDESFAMVRGKHLSISFLGGMEVSEFGDLANWIVPNKIVKGMGGAMDLSACGSKLIILMEHVSKNGKSKIVRSCTLPLTAKGVVNKIITDLCVFEVNRPSGLVLTGLQPCVTVEDVRKATECSFAVSPDLKGIGV